MSATSFSICRRLFLSRCAQVAFTTGLPLWFVRRELEAAEPAAGQSTAPNERPGVGLIGCGGMGRGDAQSASRFGDVVAVCDVDATHAAEAAKLLTVGSRRPAVYADFRRLLERADVQVVVQATPDHWHTLVNLAAVHAGKDVYGEKPLTLTIDEGKRLVKAVRERRAVLQTGSQQRSERRFRLACELVRSGRLGSLQQIVVYLPAGLRGGPFASAPPPPGLDWDFYLGQAPKVEYVKERCHLTFRYWHDYSGGTMTDWGAHHNDIVRWALGLEGPSEVEGKVLAAPVPGGYTAISEYEVTFAWGKKRVRHIVRSTTGDNIYGGIAKEDGQRNGIRFEGSDGWLWVNRGELEASSEDLIRTPLPESAAHVEVSTDHMADFFASVRSRKDPICPVEVGHRSASVCHLGVIALRLGRTLHWSPEQQVFTGENAAEANGYLARSMRAPFDYRFID